MLYQLTIQNFALIDNLVVEFDQNSNVLTGETGAGKSIIIDAVSLLLGARGQSEFIRNPTEKSIVEGVFVLDNQDQKVINHLHQIGFNLDEDRTLILTREMSAIGRNVCRINNQAVTLTVFKEIGSYLINIYGQHDFQALSQVEQHIHILDSLGDEDYRKKLKKVEEIYTYWLAEKRKLIAFQEALQEKALRLDFLEYQLAEIEEIKPLKNEDIAIKKELNVLDNLASISQNTNFAYELLYGSKSIYDYLSEVIEKLVDISEFDIVLKEVLAELESIRFQVEDCAHNLKRYYDTLDFDANLKDNLQERDFILNQLKRKHGCQTINEIIDLQQNIVREIVSLEKTEILLSETEKNSQALENEYYLHAGKLSQIRKNLAINFSQKLLEQLKDLAMEHTDFEIRFQEFAGNKTGIDKIEFLISPNPGQPLKPLAKIASGGEMSRIMLAFKVLLTDFDRSKTLIFDEIDTGIGGNILYQVAGKLHQVAQLTQVICVTHSPIVASMAANHILISKNILEDDTYTELSTLSEEQRITELARMLGDEGEITKTHAFELRKKWILEK